MPFGRSGLIATGLILTFAISGVTSGTIPVTKIALADSSRIVSLFHDGQKKVFTTDSATVGDVLRRANVILQSDDLVEPKADTQIPTGLFNINVFRARPVIIIDGQKTIRTRSPFENPKLIATSAGLKIYPEDLFESEIVTNFITDQIIGQRLVIRRATPISVKVDGKILNLRTQSTTVGALLAEKGIAMGEKDTVAPASATIVSPELQIYITRVAEIVTTKHEVLPKKTKTITDSSMYSDESKVTEEGQDGGQDVTYKIKYHNGVEVERQTIKIENKVNPVTKVVAKGNKIRDDVWSRLRACESGGIYTRNSGNGYYGAYQFDIGTWGNFGGYARADLAPPATQDQKARLTQAARGWYPWPDCARKLGLI